MKKKDIIRQILISCGISVMISTASGVGQYHLLNKKCNEILEEINDDNEETKNDINELKQSVKEITADVKELKEQYKSLNIRLEALENQDDKIFNDNLEKLKLNIDINEEMEEEIERAYSLIDSDFSKGGDFIISLAILDCQIYGENKKYVIRTIKRNEEFEVLIGINNSEILIFGINVNGEYEYTSLASDHLIINSIDTDVEKYFSYIERIPNEEPTVSYEEIKALEDDLNNSNKLTRKY